ncbi:uncharacterized protein LOC121368285 [Gigantopelta aegis]|uniref:uncharacterized protein LOC121368285 n=1 Tax=Gigantopelta aegis TaxID=1735272 RepID=UPI001B889ACF|nr:uncharacterized protein LOC121368285 [Gigantopelta aegis]
MTQVQHKSATFTIDFAEGDKPLRKPPKRFTEYKTKTKELTLDKLEKKQTEALQRRQKYEEDTLRRIRESRDECIKIDQKLWLLQQQDAKRRGLPGMECIKPMSRREAEKAIKSVAQDFNKITKKIAIETHIP